MGEEKKGRRGDKGKRRRGRGGDCFVEGLVLPGVTELVKREWEFLVSSAFSTLAGLPNPAVDGRI